MANISGSGVRHMQPIFDRHGVAVAWRHRDYIYDHQGTARALVRNRSVFTFAGEFCGRFEDGYYRDRASRAVAFEEGATGGPKQPMPRRGGVINPPPKDLPHPPKIESTPPPPRFRINAWSEVAWNDFIQGKTPASA